MIDKAHMRALLENMERAAEEVLQHDAAFFETLYALKSEIDRDPRVRSAMRVLQAAGQKAFTSFVPRVRIRARREDDVLGLPQRHEAPFAPATQQIRALTEELRSAASAVIQRSSHRRELDAIINEAVGSSDGFEGIASEIERAGYEVVICIDFSAYTKVHGADPVVPQLEPTNPAKTVDTPARLPFSNSDLKFLNALGIRVDS
jgi:hypothetical protein